MGGIFSDMIGIEAAGKEFGDALIKAEANATGELRNVALTAINYVKSFTPVFSLIIVFLLLLLLVSILFILGKMLQDLGVTGAVRALVLLVVSILLYIWFVGVQIAAAVKLKNLTTIIIASVSMGGFAVIVFFLGLFIYQVRTGKRLNPFKVDESEVDNNTNQSSNDISNGLSAHSRKQRKNAGPTNIEL